MDDDDLAIDRISDLPDSLITQILSLLNPKEAVCTCILSKRWIDLWTFMDTLEFDYRISGFDRKNKFLRFVQGVLNRRGLSPLNNFKLTWQSRSRRNHGIVEECINHAIACMPRVIYIYMDTHMVFNLPNSLFNCGSVKEMSLLGKQTLWKSQPKFINLRSLQKLELGPILIKDDLIRMLLLGCPVLEELVLTRCRLMFNEVNSNVLKKLTIKKCSISCRVKSITLKNTSTLVTADLKISNVDDERNLLGIIQATSLTLWNSPCPGITRQKYSKLPKI
ncbi:F-box/FBD/LRR-repeat protein At1g16930-like isoform X2 [Carex rostrata]